MVINSQEMTLAESKIAFFFLEQRHKEAAMLTYMMKIYTKTTQGTSHAERPINTLARRKRTRKKSEECTSSVIISHFFLAFLSLGFV